ncbi:MAG: calcium/sodium antiporter [Anaerolineales bacterium]|nr:calcium/sodium antiporter [Anaerolineales bacterium]
MTLTTILMIVAGLGLLIGGAELLVRGASRLAAALGMAPLVIGLTVVAFGTSAPELAISLQSAWQGQADLALGNVVGSNIFNILVILGLAALVAPLVVASQLVRLDVPLLIGASLLVWGMAADGALARPEGGLLFAALVGYLGFLVWQSRRAAAAAADGAAAADSDAAGGGGARLWLLNLALVAGGLALLVLGARWLVDGAVTLARGLGLSELVIGLTILAGGTSLPEVATSMLAALRGQRDIAVGNAIGSSLFNLLGVLGLTVLLAPGGVSVAPAVVNFDLPVMTAVAVAALPIFVTGKEIARWEGGVFLAYYVAYSAYLVLAATQHDALPAFSGVMLEFVVPLTVLTLLVLLGREWRRKTAVA